MATQVTVITGEGSTSYLVSAGARGPQGPNTVTTSTTTNITGIIKGNGSVVSQAVAGTDYATAAQGTLADGAAQKSANLSDLASASTARTNLVLGNVTNTSDANKPVSTAQQTALDLKANLASPTFTGTPTLPTGTIGTTQTAGNSTTALATTAFVTTADNLKANLASPTFTGTPTLPTGTIGTTQTAGNSTTALATTAFVTTADNLKANIDAQTHTGAHAFSSTTRPTSAGTGTPAATSLITRADADARYNSIGNGRVIEIPVGAISRTFTAGAVTATIGTVAIPTIIMQTTITQNNYAVAYAFVQNGATTAFNTSSNKIFGDKFGWLISGFLGSRTVGCVTKTIIGGTTVAADMVAEGTLAANGIVLESRSDVINTPKFRLVVRSGATTVVSSYSSTGIYNNGILGDFWILINGGTVFAYYRASQYGAWTLLCSVDSAIPLTTSATNSLGFATITTDSGVLGSGSTMNVIRAYETFNLTP